MQTWEMDGTGVKTKYTRSGAEYKSSRKAIGALQGKTVSVPLSVSMTAASDTGISNSDGITKNRTPEVSGVAMPSATVTLYANNQIVGSTIVASNGQWSIASQELADGSYDLSASIQTVQGAVIQQKIKTITIDTAAPQIASVTGILDGVAWDASDVFSGTLRDVDNLTQLQYWINNGTKQTIALTSTLNFNNIALSQISNLSSNSEHKLYLKAIDRAGNEMQYDYSFMRLNLPGLIDDANWIDPISAGEPDDRSSGTGTGGGGNNPSDGTGRYYIGVGGGWGYASGSGGTGWTDAPSGFSGNPPIPNLPGQDPNQQLTYLEALNVILDTAIDALSKHTTVRSKKEILREYKNSLMGTGKLVEVYGLHEQMKTMLNSLFKLGYDPTDNRVSRQEAVRSGWAFAKSVALDTVSLKLKSFESQVYGMVRGMMAKNGLTVTAAQETQLQGTISIFSRRYAVLKPEGASYAAGEHTYTSGFTEIAWFQNWNYGNELDQSLINNTDPYHILIASGKPTEANGWFGRTAEFLQTTLGALNTEQIIAGFENTQVLINGATRSAPLWRDGYQNVVAIRDGALLQELMDTGFELVRVGATNPTGAAAEGAWLEAVLEKDVVKVAGGLSQFFRGFEGIVSSYAGSWYTRKYIDALDYGQRLMKVAAAVDDPMLDAEVLRSDVLSELVNLGGAYMSLNPYTNGNLRFFLDTAKSYNSSDFSEEKATEIGDELEEFLQRSESLQGNNLRRFIRFQTGNLSTLIKIQDSDNLRKSNSYAVDLMSWGTSYYNDSNDQDQEINTFDPHGYFKELSQVENTFSRSYAIKTVSDTRQLRGPNSEEGTVVNALSSLIRSSRNDRFVDAQTRSKFIGSVEKSRNQWFIASRSYAASDRPTNLKALTAALYIWATKPSAYANTASIPSFGYAVREFNGSPSRPLSTCNRFVGDVYAMGAGTNYGVNGEGGTYPTGQPIFLDPRPGYPVDANELSSDKPATGILTNLPITVNPKLGDIVSFAPNYSDMDPTGHTGLVFGNGLYISARRGTDHIGDQVDDGVMIKFIGTSPQPIRYRTFIRAGDTSYI